jgi:hypothetical protein
MSRAALIDVYISGLALAEVAIVGAGRRCRIHTDGDGDLAPGEPVAQRYLFKPSHAELVLAEIGPEGLSGQPAGALADAIERAAAKLGARHHSPAELRKAAAEQVAEIVERVKSAGLSGRLKMWNKRYKQYRLEAVAKSEPAIPYANYIEIVVTTPTVRQLAATGRMI